MLLRLFFIQRPALARRLLPVTLRMSEEREDYGRLWIDKERPELAQVIYRNLHFKEKSKISLLKSACNSPNLRLGYRLPSIGCGRGGIGRHVRLRGVYRKV